MRTGLKLAELARATGGRLLAGEPEAAIEGVTIDSRAVSPRSLFIALPGSRTDGHRFVAAAAAAGAAAALVSRPVEAPSGLGLVSVPDTVAALGDLARHHVDRLRGRLRVVAVTGSVGKTSTRNLCAAVLSSRLRVLQPQGNWNTEIGVPLTCLRLGPEHDAVVLEYAMRGPGQVAQLCQLCRPDVGVLTLIGASHLEMLGSLGAVAEAKGALVEALPATGAAILNGDDPWQRPMAGRSRAPVLRYGFGDGVDVTARDIEPLGAEGSRFRLVTPAGTAVVRMRPVGRHQVANALAAAAVGHACGLSPEAIAGGLGAAEGVEGRVTPRDLGVVRLLDDTYNASPQSCLAALAALADVAPPEHRVAVLGDMLELGDFCESAHREVGEAARRLPVRALLAVGPRSAAMADAAGPVGTHCPAVEAAAARLPEVLRPGDAVLLKGSRDMHMEALAAVVARWAAAGGGPPAS